jgi:hypothetical protein
MPVELFMKQVTTAQLRKIVELTQRHMRFLYREVGLFARTTQNPSKRLIVYGREGAKSERAGGMTGTTLFLLMKNGRFQSEMGFPKRYNPERNVGNALFKSLRTKVKRSTRSIRLMRVMWELDYKNVVDMVRYRLPSGKGDGGYLHWLKFLDPSEEVAGYKFTPVVALKRGVKKAARMQKGGTRRPRAFGRPGVGPSNAGWMVKGPGVWKLSSRANPLGVRGDWYQESIPDVWFPLLQYWKRKVSMLHIKTLRKYQTGLRGFA